MFVKGTSGKLLSEIYLTAWKYGLKTTYYLRSLAASQIEKSTLDATKYGFTQKREYEALAGSKSAASEGAAVEAGANGGNGANGKSVAEVPMAEVPVAATDDPNAGLCRIDDPECESCQ